MILSHKGDLKPQRSHGYDNSFEPGRRGSGFYDSTGPSQRRRYSESIVPNGVGYGYNDSRDRVCRGIMLLLF